MDNPEELPSSVDVLLLGTGLPESILAAACARAGLSVLHLDRNDYYGDAWSSFNLKSIVDWANAQQSTEKCEEVPVSDELLQDGEHLLRPSHFQRFRDVRLRTPFEDSAAVSDDSSGADGVSEVASDTFREVGSDPVREAWEKAEKLFRKFSLDLLPKVLLSRGDMVQTATDSNVGNYCEFQCVDRFLSFGGNFTQDGPIKDLHTLPCSRAEIFQSDALSMLEKRRVMKFLTVCMNWQQNGKEFDDSQDISNLTFDEFLESKGISGNLKIFINDTVGVLEPNASALKGLNAICAFMDSVGRFGNSPFLWTLYGSGELPQCFCRLCAVFGGIYCLNRSVDAFVVKSGRIVGVLSGGRRIECGRLVANGCYVPAEYLRAPEGGNCLQRAILICDRSLLPDSRKDHISLLNLGRLCGTGAAYLLETGYGACTSPKGYHVSHITASGLDPSSRELLPSVIDRLFLTTTSSSSSSEEEDERPRMLWSLLFNVTEPSVDEAALPTNFVVVPPVDGALEYSPLVVKIRSIFKELWPDLDFLPMSLRRPEEEEEEAEDSLRESGDSESRGEDGGDGQKDEQTASQAAATEGDSPPANASENSPDS